MLRVVAIDGLRLLQVKNPWCRKRWRGRYSPGDTKHWTPHLKKALAYDAAKATQFDNGIFWIDYESVRRFFGSMHMNWNPDLFRYRRVVHGRWELAAPGPKSDRYCIFDNPQYHLGVQASGGDELLASSSSGGGGGGAKKAKTVTIWLLLTRHALVKEEDDDESVPLMAIHAYYSKGRRRKLYSRSAKALSDGVCVVVAKAHVHAQASF